MLASETGRRAARRPRGWRSSRTPPGPLCATLLPPLRDELQIVRAPDDALGGADPGHHSRVGVGGLSGVGRVLAAGSYTDELQHGMIDFCADCPRADRIREPGAAMSRGPSPAGGAARGAPAGGRGVCLSPGEPLRDGGGHPGRTCRSTSAATGRKSPRPMRNGKAPSGCATGSSSRRWAPQPTPAERAVRREWDDFDPYFDHLILMSLDPAIADPLDRVVGAYRLMRDEVARAGRGFYGAERVRSGADRRGRAARRSSSGAPASRPRTAAGRRCTCSGTASRATCWSGGSSSCSGWRASTAPIPRRSPRRSRTSTTSIWRRRICRVRARPAHYLDMNLMPRAAIEPARALQAIPSLIKAYLRLGGFVGDGAFVDQDFNTIDVCVVMDTGRMKERYLRFLPAHPGAAEVRAGWNGAEPPVLPPLAAGERLRLGLRAAWAVVALAVLFAVFLPLRGIDLVAARVAGRPVTGSGRRWCGSGRRRRCRRSGSRSSGGARRCGAAAPSSPTIRAGSTSWRCSGRRRRSWCRRPRCGRGR